MEEKFIKLKNYIENWKLNNPKYEDYNLENVVHILNNFNKIFENDSLDLGKEYYVSEWSYNPICDGICTYKEIIRENKNNIYYTQTNHRKYFIWDIWDKKEYSDYLCDFKNKFAYDWDKGISKFK